MTLKVDFNNPHIIQGHLEQILPQLTTQHGLDDKELKAIQERIVIGEEGGIAYLLFPEHNYQTVSEFRAQDLDAFQKVKDYMDAVQDYVKTAETRATQAYGFDLLSADNNKLKFFKDNSYVYSAAIGGDIYGSDMLQKFIDMIITGRETMNGNYDKIMSLAKELAPRNRD